MKKENIVSNNFNDEMYSPPRLKRARTKPPRGNRDEENNSTHPLDNDENMDVPQGGEWGIPGAGQTAAAFRMRFGKPSLYDGSKVGAKKIQKYDTEKTAQRANQIKPDRLIAYSRGAAVYNQARRDEPDMPTDIPVTYVAPSSYRRWSDAPVPKAPRGSVTMIGDADTVVPMKQACQNAKAAGTRLYVQPGYSHTGIMYSGGDIDQDAFELDVDSCLADPDLPNWDKAPAARPGELEKQTELIKKHIKTEALLREIVRNLI